MKAFFEFIAMLSLGRVFDLVRGLIKGHCVRLYVNFIQHMRSVYVAVILTIGCLLLLLSGFLLLHVALFLYLPWDLSNRILLLFVLGLSYMLISLVLFGYFMSRGQWLKASGAKRMLDDLSDNNN